MKAINKILVLCMVFSAVSAKSFAECEKQFTGSKKVLNGAAVNISDPSDGRPGPSSNKADKTGKKTEPVKDPKKEDGSSG